MNQGIWIDDYENTPTHIYEISTCLDIYSWYLGDDYRTIHQPNYHHTLTIL